MASYVEQAIAKLKEFEGSISWMYRDTVGKVTVGVGLMLPDAKAAATLPFLLGERRATADEITKEFERVNALAKGRPAGFYRKDGGLRLAEGAIEEKLRGVLEGFESYLRAHIRGYDRVPDAVKLALLDMVYNLGPGKLFEGFPHLIAAVEAGDWTKAAEMSSRKGPGPERNAWTRSQFLAAARGVAIKAEAEVESFGRSWMPALVGLGALAFAVWAATLGSANDRR